MSGEEGDVSEGEGHYFAYFLSGTDLVKRVDTCCLQEIFTD